MRSILTGIAALAGVALALGYTGAAWPPGDALAVGRIHASVVLALAGGLLILTRATRRGLLAASAGLAVAASVVWCYLAPAGPAPEGTIYRLYQKNLLAHAWPRRPLAAEIVASGAEIVTLQEVSAHNREFMGALFAAYPTQVSCPFAGVGDVAILSLWPMVPGTASCAGQDGLALVRLVAPDGQEVWAASLHLYWPWPFGQAGQVERVIPRIMALDGPVILAGDFNMVPWGASVRRIAQAARAERAGPYRTTFPEFAPLAPFAIDHVLLPAGAAVLTETRPGHGSDHLGVLAHFSLAQMANGAP
jgi:endonuclease/exonuclease/phosphatase (EEP) superfamily protein YafD